MAFTSLSFIVLILGTVLLAAAVPRPSGRSLVLFGANLVFIASYVGRALEIVPLAVFLLLSFFVIEGVRRTRSSSAQWVGLAAIIGAFVVLKRYAFLGAFSPLPFPYLVIGLSYLLFRVVQLVVDAKQGELAEAVPILDFFNYTCNFLCFVAGPIQRYEDYKAQAERPLELDEGKVFRAFARVIKGFFKVGVVSAIFNNLFGTVSMRVLGHASAGAPSVFVFAVTYLAAVVFYTVYLYTNFAGYMDIVIGVGALVGQDLPENFNQPFLARSFLDFWSRWHMTLSAWFKTYVFNPLLTALTSRFPSPRATATLGVISFFVTFLIMGLWHGSTRVFVVYGLILGAGASLNKLWQVMMAKRLGKQRYKALGERTLAIYLSRGLTFAYFALALTCLWVDMPQLRSLSGHLGALGLVGGYFGLALAGAASFLIWDWVASRVAVLGTAADWAQGGVVARNLGLALQVLVIVSVASFFHKAPEFVYRAF